MFIRHEIKVITYPNKGDLHDFIGLSVPVFPYHIYEFIELNLVEIIQRFLPEIIPSGAQKFHEKTPTWM